MNFDLTEEQGLLRNLIQRFTDDHYDPVKRLSYVRQNNGFCSKNWQTLAEMGVLAFPYAEASGGLGGGNVELITVMESLGRAVVTEPVMPVVVLAGRLIEAAGTNAQRDEWLPRLTMGEAFVALAHNEHAARFSQHAITTKASIRGDMITLDGNKRMVMGGSFADALIVSALNADGKIALYLVSPKADGVAIRNYRLTDGSVASDITLTGAHAEPMQGGEVALDVVIDEARLAICAELVGLMSMMFDATLDYVKTRRQFGSAIGQFQAIQHRMADNYVRVELSRGQLYRAAAINTDDAARGAAIAGAKAYIADAAMAVGEDSIQLHGGIGTTEELLVGQAFKRVMLLSALFGDSDWETRRYIAATR